MISKIKYIALCGLILAFFSCKKKQEYRINKNKSIVATIDSISITQNEVDLFVKQKLYDELSRIHLIRKLALDEIINKKILKRQADKQKITTEKLLQSLYDKKVNDSNIIKFSKENDFDKQGVNSIEKNIVNYDINSKKGNALLIKRFKSFILSKYIDSLKSKSKINFFLKTPTPPKTKLDQSLVHFYGNKNSKVTLIEISDFECDMCREYNPIFKQLFDKYKDDVAFGFVNYGSYVSKPAIASEVAGMQGKFLEMKELLFKENNNYTDNKIELLALKLNLDIKKFKNDFNNPDLKNKLKENYDLIHRSGIYGTPTILINYRIMHNSSSKEELEKFLVKKIKESKK
ncbi:thioredoxin domain-containing protein [Polaribacter sp. MSW13]|uniref:Thioredoxin domain-containing protein n=1 Tax=Polaribacter marinus TaxID=2916838 RepID=A0A9X1VQD1_9FLAO|nr:thioredoxin domain-containing protein [Polaribacter marinus]MCI2230313.1 thioredoxin domain-containing protein [Polaribacter marinus]